MSGPRPLRTLLSTWKPARQSGRTFLRRDDALAQLALAWSAAVGPVVAARSRPLRFAAGTLLVLTASSAWSDELSLLAPRILTALQRSCPQVQLRRLRFRVAGGRSRQLFASLAQRGAVLPAASSARATDFAPALAGPDEIPDSAHSAGGDISAIIADLRAQQARLDEHRARSGWIACRQCGNRFQGGAARTALCAACAESNRRSLEANVERALVQAPWLQWPDINEHLPHASRQVVDRVRRRLSTRWELELKFAQRRVRRSATTPQDRVIAWSYVMLLARLPQRELGPAVINDVLGADWAAILLHDQRSAGNSQRKAARPPQQKTKY